MQQGETQAAAVLSLLAQILTDLFIAPPAFSGILSAGLQGWTLLLS